MKRLRTCTGWLALAGHCFAIVGAYALHRPHTGECCSSGSHDDHPAHHCEVHNAPHHHHDADPERPDDTAKDPDSPDQHDQDDCGWCRFLASAGTEPQVVEPPRQVEIVFSPILSFRPAPTGTAPARPAVRGPPC